MLAHSPFSRSLSTISRQSSPSTIIPEEPSETASREGPAPSGASPRGASVTCLQHPVRAAATKRGPPRGEPSNRPGAVSEKVWPCQDGGTPICPMPALTLRRLSLSWSPEKSLKCVFEAWTPLRQTPPSKNLRASFLRPLRVSRREPISPKNGPAFRAGPCPPCARGAAWEAGRKPLRARGGRTAARFCASLSWVPASRTKCSRGRTAGRGRGRGRRVRMGSTCPPAGARAARGRGRRGGPAWSGARHRPVPAR